MAISKAQSGVRVISDVNKRTGTGHPLLGLILPPKQKTHNGKPVLGLIVSDSGKTSHLMGRLLLSDGTVAPAGSHFEGKMATKPAGKATRPLFGLIVDPHKRHKPAVLFGLIVTPDGKKHRGHLQGRIVDPGTNKPLLGLILPPNKMPTAS